MSEIDYTTFTTLKERMNTKFPILLQGYLNDLETYIDQIHTNVGEGGDIRAIIHASHSLKSSSGLLGLVHLSQASHELEYAAKQMEETGNIQHNKLEDLTKKLDEAAAHIKPLLNTELTAVQAS